MWQSPTIKSATAHLIILLAITQPSDAAEAVAPIVSIEIRMNTCNNWAIHQTYTATPVDNSIVEQLGQYNYYSWNVHFHTQNYPGHVGKWTTPTPLHGSPADKLAAINRAIFSTPDPTPGQTKTIVNQHQGSCAASEGLRECVGVFVSSSNDEHKTREPTTFPAGMCAGIPPTGTQCDFTTPNAVVDLGTGSSGRRSGGVAVTVQCTAATDFRITNVTTTPGSSGEITNVAVTADGRPLPTELHGEAGVTVIDLGVTADVSGEGRHGISQILRIDIP